MDEQTTEKEETLSASPQAPVQLEIPEKHPVPVFPDGGAQAWATVLGA